MAGLDRFWPSWPLCEQMRCLYPRAQEFSPAAVPPTADALRPHRAVILELQKPPGTRS